MKVDFTDYRLKELFESLEGVDDLEYPENAMIIYKLMLDKLGLDFRSVEAKELGYDSSEFAEAAFMGLVHFPFLSDIHILTSDMKDKISRLNNRLSNEE